MIIHKTGTMLATGQGPIATPLGSESVTDGNGVRDPGVTAGAEGPGRAGGGGGTTSELGFKIKYLSGGGTSDQRLGNETASTPVLGPCVEVERSSGDRSPSPPAPQRGGSRPPARHLPSFPLFCFPFSETKPTYRDHPDASAVHLPRPAPLPGRSLCRPPLSAAPQCCPHPKLPTLRGGGTRGQSSSVGRRPAFPS